MEAYGHGLGHGIGLETHEPPALRRGVDVTLDAGMVFSVEPGIYLPGVTGSGVIESPADVIARWTLELEALVAEGGLFMLTNHPFVSGRASRAAGLESLIERARSIDGLWIATAAEIAEHVETLPLEPVFHAPPELPPQPW